MSESKNIFVLTGPIRTGKTTALLHWAEKKEGVYGIAQPVLNGMRTLLDLKSNEIRPLESDNEDEETISVGNYKFLKSSFEWAKKVLLDAVEKNPEWIVIDEYGKLELDNNGLEPVVSSIISSNLTDVTNVILVIRDYLVDKSINKLEIPDRLKLIKSLSELDE